MLPKKRFMDERIAFCCGDFGFTIGRTAISSPVLRALKLRQSIRRVSCALADNDRPMRYRASTFDCSPSSHERAAVLPDRRTPERFTPMLASGFCRAADHCRYSPARRTNAEITLCEAPLIPC